MPSPAEVDNFQQLLATLSAKAALQISDLWDKLVYADTATRWQALEAAYPNIVDPFLAASGTVSAEWYSSLNPSAAFAVQAAPPVAKDTLMSNIGWALTQTNPLDALIGSVERQVFNQSRTTILSNVEREGVKFARHASANACAFCRVLATRGAVYASEASAQSVVGRGKDLSLSERRMRRSAAGLPFRPRFDARGAAIDPKAVSLGGYKRRGARGRFLAGGSGQLRGKRALGDKYHDNCHCIAVPVRAGDSYNPPDYVNQWETDYVNAVQAAKAAGNTKGEFGAIDLDAVVNEMRKATYPQRKDALNERRRELYAAKKQGEQPNG